MLKKELKKKEKNTNPKYSKLNKININPKHLIIRILILLIMNLFTEIMLFNRLTFSFQISFNIIFIAFWIGVIELILGRKRWFRLHPFNYWGAFLTPLIFNIIVNLFIYKYLNIYSVTGILTALITTLLIDYESGVLSSFIFALYFGILYGYDIQYMFLIFIPAIIVALIARKIMRRIEILLPFVASTGLQIIFLFLFGLSYNPDNYLVLLLSNFMAILFTMGVLPFFEFLTRVYSDIGLLELGNLNHPLLKKLTLKAPGTYYHSMIIANLAESAVESIGGNPILARVGAYFHDIGKVWKPTYFTENQKNENPHDKVSPKLSSLILNNHIKYGKEMAEKNRLPVLIEDMILQHQGTRVKQFFYKKYYDQTGIKDVDMFKYPGPIPQFKESAVLMICDVTEAIQRSMKDLDTNDLNDKISELIHSLFFEGQLDDCGLRLTEINRVKGRIIRTVMEMSHKRIKYPKIEKNDLLR